MSLFFSGSWGHCLNPPFHSEHFERTQSRGSTIPLHLSPPIGEKGGGGAHTPKYRAPLGPASCCPSLFAVGVGVRVLRTRRCGGSGEGGGVGTRPRYLIVCLWLRGGGGVGWHAPESLARHLRGERGTAEWSKPPQTVMMDLVWGGGAKHVMKVS